LTDGTRLAYSSEIRKLDIYPSHADKTTGDIVMSIRVMHRKVSLQDVESVHRNGNEGSIHMRPAAGINRDDEMDGIDLHNA
jgi:hypothetical protein